MAISIIQPALTNAAIFAALDYIPASAGAVVMSDGSAASPGMFFGSDVDTGFYKYDTNILGIASAGKRTALVYYRLINGLDDNATITLGTGADISTTTNDTYPSTINFPAVNLSANSNVIACSFGDLVVTATDQVQKTSPQGILEMDKLELFQSGGAVTFDRAFNTRFRLALPKTGVTLTDSVGITFVLPAPSDVTGTVTNAIAIDIPSWAAGGASNYYGIRFANNPAGGSIVSTDGTDLSIKASVGGTLNGTVYIDGRGTAGRVNIQTNDRDVAKFETVSSSLNFLRFFANSVPTVMAGHLSTADVDLQLSSKGAGILSLMTGGAAREQVRILDIASAAIRIEMVGAAAGGSPRIGTNTSNLALGTGAAIATNATAGFVMVPGMAGTPSGAPTAADAGKIPIVYDTSANKLWAYNGSWRSVALT